MKTLFAMVAAVLALSTPAFAQDPTLSGAWRLSAKVETMPYDLLCHFEQIGDVVQGACVETFTHLPMTRAGRTHALTSGRLDGDHVTFAHGGSFLLSKFSVKYAGVVDGDRMTGQIAVFGHTGDFTAIRES